MTVELDWHGHSARIEVHDQNDNQLVNIDSHTAPVRFALEKGTKIRVRLLTSKSVY